MLSRNGICYDFSVSPYRCTVDNIVYVFSSQLHLDKFRDKLEDHRRTVYVSLTKRFGVGVDVSTLADIVLYNKIERRGFLIETEDGILSCREKITFVGNNQIMMR